MRVEMNREEFLAKLEMVAPGLATKEAVQQSSCFVFQNDKVITFNDELSCRIPCPLKGISGAVNALPLMSLLQKLVEDTITLEIDKDTGQFMVRGKSGRKAGITREEVITLPIKSVEPPNKKKWKDLDPEFEEAVNIVQRCASKDSNQFDLTCIHLTPTYAEACDNYQMARYPVKTGVKSDCLIKRDSLRHIRGLGMNRVCETESWIHYQNKEELILSTRIQKGDFQDLSKFLRPGGSPMTLPGGLAAALEKASIFSEANVENDVVLVTLRSKQLIVRGEGPNGFFQEVKEISYDGPSLEFTIDPVLLIEITSQTNECYLEAGRMRVDGGGKFVYVTALGKV